MFYAIRMADLSRRLHPALFLSMLFFLTAIGGAPARAEVPLLSPPAREGSAGEKIQLLAGQAFDGSKPMLFAVRMVMPDGWHTYWRNPGDSGIAPRFDWSASENVKAVELLWPVPQRFDAEGDITFGYAHEVVWPVLVQVDDPDKPVTVRLQMDYGVCLDICVPGSYEQGLTMAAGVSVRPEIISANRNVIAPFLARVPRSLEAGESLVIKSDGKVLQVRLRGVATDPDLIVEGPRGIRFARPMQGREGDLLLYRVPYKMAGNARLVGQDVTLVWTGPETAIEVTRKVQ